MMQVCLALVPTKCLSETQRYRCPVSTVMACEKADTCTCIYEYARTWTQRYWHKKILNLLLDVTKMKFFVFKKAGGVLMAGLNTLTSLPM